MTLRGGNVVDEDGDADRVVDGLEMLVKSFLRRLVVIGRDHQHRIGAGLLGVLGEFDRLVRVVGAGARDDRHASARLVDADVDDAAVLGVAQGRALAGGADRHEPVRTRTDLPIDQRAERRLVEFAVLEGRHQRRHRAVKLRALLHSRSSVSRAAAAPAAPTHRPSPAPAKGASEARFPPACGCGLGKRFGLAATPPRSTRRSRLPRCGPSSSRGDGGPQWLTSRRGDRVREAAEIGMSASPSRLAASRLPAGPTLAILVAVASVGGLAVRPKPAPPAAAAVPPPAPRRRLSRRR